MENVKFNWLKLVKENENRIKEGLEEIYEDACMDYIGMFRGISRLVIYKDGDLSKLYDTNSDNYYSNDALEIGRIEDFKPWENSDNVYSDWIKQLLTKDEECNFKQYIIQEKEDELEGFYWEMFVEMSDLEDYNEDIYNRVVKDCIETDINNNAGEFASQRFEYILQDLEE